ncbi:hypothetical protein A33M_0988 [Rhodovulum sp. PH10]|nr:hypothetical protein A33M_0988 [Rhodovulum sp. PH10]
MPFLRDLEVAADHAEIAESRFRQEAAQRIAALEAERAFAFRRLNVMRTVTEAVAGAPGEDEAVAAALDAVREKLGWAADSEPHVEVLAHFAPVPQAIHRSLAAPDDPPEPSPQDALVEFERWYADERRGPFWTLFEQRMPETPLVDF